MSCAGSKISEPEHNAEEHTYAYINELENPCGEPYLVDLDS
jgi:hypothetical protein